MLAGRLAAVVGEEHVRDDPGALRVYAHDATPLHHGMPDAVVFPRTAQEVSGILRLAGESGLCVTPREPAATSAPAPFPTAAGSSCA